MRRLVVKDCLNNKMIDIYKQLDEIVEKECEASYVEVFEPTYMKSQDGIIEDNHFKDGVLEYNINRVKTRLEETNNQLEPSLTNLKASNTITDNQYNALCSGDRNDILLAFNIELMDMSDKIVSDLVAKKGVEDFKASEDIEVGE